MTEQLLPAMVELVWELASCGRGVKIFKRKSAHFKTKYLLFILFDV